LIAYIKKTIVFPAFLKIYLFSIKTIFSKTNNMKATTQILLLASLFFFTSFTMAPENELYGTYGVADADPAQIELVLNEDHTFIYQDYSNSAKKIEVSGNWDLNKGHVILKDAEADVKFHTKWKISGDNKVAKSRMGMTFYRLVRK